ncbi:hypothetical protein [Streptomyces sp. NPDC051567]|uniref:hypothetical protein n=1 Tax=Streptomyces sp. NPDC051567 TaxID=3365660 RepID=UPI003795C19F
MARTGNTGPPPPPAGGGLGAGVRHLRTEWGRWWRTEDWSDTHVAHHVLNDQFRTWQQFQQRNRGEVQQNIGLLKEQQKVQRQSQMMQMNMQRQRQRQGRYGYGGYGGGGGASPMISYRMMQWAQLQMRMGQKEFRHLEITPSMLHIGRGQVRARRHRAAAAWLLALGACWAGLWWASALVALAVTVIAALVFVVTATAAGRNPAPRRPPVPRLLFIPPTAPAHTELAAEPEPQPFPLREAGRDPQRVRECIALALRSEKARVGHIDIPEETTWGWTVPLVLSGGTLGDLVRLLPRLTTPLRVGAGRVIAQRTSGEDSAAVTLRILTSDPFATAAPYPVRPPLSCSITDPFSIGVSIDGDHTPVVMAGQSALIVARTGGGKSGMVRSLAEYATACSDAVVVDIDPTGRGLGPLGPCAARRALTPENAERALEYLLALAQARIAALGPTEDNWRVAPDKPAVLGFVDEFPELTKKGKATAIALTRLGRKSRVTLVICTTDATEDVMGDAIGDALGVRILMSCRQADVPLVVGQADAAARGWLPHLLVPSPGEWEPADAGQYYCVTPRHRDPVLRYVSYLDPGTAAVRARERAAAGLPPLTMPVPATAAAATKPAPPIAALLLAAFATHGDPEVMSVGQISEHLAAVDPGTWRQWDGRTDRLAMIGRTIKNQLAAGGLDIATGRLSALPGRPTGYRLTDIRDALS